MALPRRPVVVVEDHLYHVDQLLGLLGARGPDLLERLTVVCLDRRGPDTQAAVARWRRDYPAVAVVADDDDALRPLPTAVYASGPHYAKLIAELLAPRGILVQDIQLETLRFVPADQWWETIYLANTVRGMFASRPPQALFLSNKRGFHATFGKDLLDVGFDPRDVLHKDELDVALVPLLRRRLHEAFPLVLDRGDRPPRWLTRDPEEHAELATELDLVLWDERATKLGLGGRSVRARGERVELAASGHEAQTWRALVDAHIEGLAGVSTDAVGERVAPELADRAERSNAAARHVYALRKRLSGDALQTVDHHYRLADELSVGRVRRRLRH